MASSMEGTNMSLVQAYVQNTQVVKVLQGVKQAGIDASLDLKAGSRIDVGGGEGYATNMNTNTAAATAATATQTLGAFASQVLSIAQRDPS